VAGARGQLERRRTRDRGGRRSGLRSGRTVYCVSSGVRGFKE
jgi:hypothetical protein